MLWGYAADLRAYDFGTSIVIDAKEDLFAAGVDYTTGKIKNLPLTSTGRMDATIIKVSQGGKSTAYCEP